MKKLYFLLFTSSLFTTSKAQIVNIPDANFKAKLLSASPTKKIGRDLSGNHIKIDANYDGEIQISEALNVGSLSINHPSYDIVTPKIQDLTGIESFKNITFLSISDHEIYSLNVTSLVSLTYLYCESNKLTTLDVAPLINLTYLNCNSNQLTTLDVTPLVNLTELICGSNQLTTLDVTPLVELTNFSCPYNKLSSLDVTPLVKLTSLGCGYNKLSLLDVTPLIELKTLSCPVNKLTSLNVIPLVKLGYFTCEGNLLNTLDISSLNLWYFDCSSNEPLISLFLKNGKNDKYVNIAPNPNLKYICVDEDELVTIQNIITDNKYTNCQVNSYCSFNPGGIFYTIQGNTKFDSNTNGCDFADINYSNLKFAITDGTNSGSLTSNTTGNYYIPVQTGTHTITPATENSSYFTISPTNVVVSFPNQTSPLTQDFCVTANGIHPDLEVTVLPINRARPGFDASYKIIYKNKGTQTQSGAVNLTFNDAVLDLVVANPLVTTQTVNNLSWNFIDFKPFETREIEVTVNVNSPMETPAINNDDVLSYTSTITSTSTDETPSDNSFTLNQIVVGSYDPNDKTCLEGTTIPPSSVGKYVHYMIRFENKGTAEAQNVVVKDMIDTSKFDISSLIVTQGSHPFVTRITETNKVEFIFENINLPFDDATNDGYVAFKVKTKPSLVVGDSFSNTASIYFDYNFPIVTNTATTSVLQNLGTHDFEFSTYFSVYPNPAKNILSVDIKKQIELTSISIFNTVGQQILVIPNAQKTTQVDVSNLKTGNYFIKVTSNKGSASGKFVKE